MKMTIEAGRDFSLVLEPWGHTEPVRKGQKILLEYERMFDSDGNEVWPLISFQESEKLRVDLPSIAFRAYVDDKIVYDCWRPGPN